MKLAGVLLSFNNRKADVFAVNVTAGDAASECWREITNQPIVGWEGRSG